VAADRCHAVASGIPLRPLHHLRRRGECDRCYRRSRRNTRSHIEISNDAGREAPIHKPACLQRRGFRSPHLFRVSLAVLDHGRQGDGLENRRLYRASLSTAEDRERVSLKRDPACQIWPLGFARLGIAQARPHPPIENAASIPRIASTPIFKTAGASALKKRSPAFHPRQSIKSNVWNGLGAIIQMTVPRRSGFGPLSAAAKLSRDPNP
jgi:hypothetical protein